MILHNLKIDFEYRKIEFGKSGIYFGKSFVYRDDSKFNYGFPKIFPHNAKRLSGVSKSNSKNSKRIVLYRNFLNVPAFLLKFLLTKFQTN